VLTMSEAVTHPHNAARGTFVEVGGAMQPAPAPRYSGTATATPEPAPMPGDQTEEILGALGIGADEIAALREAGTVA
jgi:alpha-methylacyl-CoA racemase